MEQVENLENKNIELINRLIYNRENPIDWIKNNVKIKHPAYGIIPFNLYDFQEKIIKLFLAKNFIIALKSRQVGMSTLVQSICLWSAMHYANYNILILSAGMRNASSFLEKIKTMYEYLPDNGLKLSLNTDNKQTLIFSNGSKIVAIPATRSASLGESINLLIIDEAGFIERVEEVYQASYPTISRAFNSVSGKPFGIIVISTPNGVFGTGKWYYDMYKGSLVGDNKYIPVKIHWTAIPEYDEQWYIDQCSQLNWNFRSISAELELSFVSSGNTYIPGQILDSIAITEPIEKAKDNHFWLWEEPIKDEIYIMGVDVAYGDAKDSSTIQIIKASTLDQVGEYDSNVIMVDDFAEVIIKIAKMFNNALINIERNAVGKVLIDKLIKKTSGGIGLNLYRDIKLNDLNTTSFKENEIFNSNIGTNVTGQSRDILLANMYSIILDKYTESLKNIISETEDDSSARSKFELLMAGKKQNIIKKQGIIKSERLYHQLLGFIIDNHGKPAGEHDDLVLAWVHALYCYTKSKAFLLKDIAKIMSETYGATDAKRNQLETLKFMQERTDSSVWKSLTIEQLQEVLDEENIQNNKINKEEEQEIAPLKKLYNAFYK